MIKTEEAKRIVLKHTSPMNPERVDILSSLDRVLAENIYATTDLPLFNNSAMDGYAVCAEDTCGASKFNPRVLEVVDNIPAGCVPRKKLKNGQAIRIMTGAPIPKGADAVVIVEDTKLVDGQIELYQEVEKGGNVRFRGEDVRRGELVVRAGSVVRPQEIGMFAALGIGKVKIIKSPRVAIISTGNELVESGKALKPGKIRNINGYFLYSQVIKYGGIPVNLGIAKDNRKEIKNKINKGLSYDMLIVSGGVSVGDYDLMKVVLTELGMKRKFWQVAIKPGKPLLFGLLDKVPVFGLPGNPVSSMITFEQFAGPALLKMQGKTKSPNQMVLAILEESIKKAPGKRYFLRGIVSQKKGRYYVKSSGSQSSAAMKSMVSANGLIILPEAVTVAHKGAKVEVQMFER